MTDYTPAQIRKIKTHYTKLRRGYFSCMKLILECSQGGMEWEEMRDVIALEKPCPLATTGRCQNQNFADGGSRINIYKAVRELGLINPVKPPKQATLPFVQGWLQETA